MEPLVAFDLDMLASRFNLRVGRRNARQITVLCIFHGEKTPSLVIWRGFQTWHCFGCQTGGTVVQLIAVLEELNAPGTGRDLVPEQVELALEAWGFE